MGVSKWLKLKIALGLKLDSCLHSPRTIEGPPPPPPPAGRLSGPVAASPPPASSSSGLRLSPMDICAICLSTMEPGNGHAIFTAECSHSFHFHCIASNVKHGKITCPICRSKWKEIPRLNPSSEEYHSRMQSRMSSPPQPQHNPLPRRMRMDPTWTEPALFDDDDQVSDENTRRGFSEASVELKMYPEVSAVQKSKALSNFSILVHLKAPVAAKPCSEQETSRAPVDLITVLDVSGSMAGSKMALLKRAMGFVIDNMGPSDRLSVIAFSSTSRRLFPLRRMTDIGKQEALRAVNALTSNGGTNISEGLRKGFRVLTDCRWKNPIGSIILLSDGQDTYTDRDRNSSFFHRAGFHTPIHTFGFGADHDAITMHQISENSGGTFSFIEAESVLQDAFAQCIGGLLSVVVKELKVEVDCVDSKLHLVEIKSGSYRNVMDSDKRKACIEVGDMYAEEERDFLVTTDIPIHESDEMSLIKVECHYKHLVGESTFVRSEVKIQRPVSTGELPVSMEVDRERNRLRSAEAMSEARTAAERGDLGFAVSVLESCRKALLESASGRAGDRLCVALESELREMGERMVSRQVYEASGRAYVLSGLSSHSWQRATARGETSGGSGVLQAYQTQSMTDMVNLSQTMVLGSPRSAGRPARPRRGDF